MSRYCVGNLVLALVLSSVILVGCPISGGHTVPPVAQFDARPVLGHLPLVVQFSDGSKAGTSPIRTWLWDFGDGTTSDLPNPTHTYLVAGSYEISLSVTTALGTSRLSKPNYVIVKEPAIVAAIGSAGGSVDAEGFEVNVPAGALGEQVIIAMAPNEGTVRALRTEQEQLISEPVSIALDKEGVRIDPRKPVTLTIPFVLSMVPAADRNGTKVQILCQLDSGLVVPVMGELDGSAIKARVTGLPRRATYAVAYRPFAQADSFDVPDMAKTPTPYRWSVNAWEWCYTTDRIQELTALRIAGLNTVASYDRRNWTMDQLDTTMADLESTMDKVHAGLRDSGFISPTLAPSLGGEYVLSLYPMNERTVQQYTRLSEVTFATNLFGQIVVDPAQLIAICKRNATGTFDERQELEFPNAFAQTFFRSIYPGYDYPALTQLATVDRDSSGNLRRVSFARAFNDGIATYLGQIFDGRSVARSFGDNEFGNLGEPLFAPLSATMPDYAYAAQDFFFYLTHRFAAGDPLAYVGDSYEGVLELIRVREMSAGVSTVNDALDQARIAVDISLDRFFGVSLSDVYWDYVVSRAYRNNGSAVLRLTDYERTANTLNEDRFGSASLFKEVFSSSAETIGFTPTTNASFKNIPPLTTRAIVLEAGGAVGDLRLSTNAYEWAPDQNGKSMGILVFKDGESNGIPITPVNSRITLPNFGDDDDVSTIDFTRAIILLSNVTLDRVYSARITAEIISTDPGGQTGRIEGVVGNAQTLAPLSGVLVDVRTVAGNVVGGIVGSASSNSQGSFTVSNLPVGEVEVSFTKTGFVTKKQRATIVANQATSLLVGLTPTP